MKIFLWTEIPDVVQCCVSVWWGRVSREVRVDVRVDVEYADACMGLDTCACVWMSESCTGSRVDFLGRLLLF